VVSKSDLLVAVLVLITSQVMLEFAPANAGGVGILLAMFGMETGHYVGLALGVFSGIVGLALYRKVNRVTIAVSVLSILLGLMFLAIMIYHWPMDTMAIIADLTLLVGIIGIVGSALLKTKNGTTSPTKHEAS
jgi:hypothetical protein